RYPASATSRAALPTSSRAATSVSAIRPTTRLWARSQSRYAYRTKNRPASVDICVNSLLTPFRSLTTVRPGERDGRIGERRAHHRAPCLRPGGRGEVARSALPRGGPRGPDRLGRRRPGAGRAALPRRPRRFVRRLRRPPRAGSGARRAARTRPAHPLRPARVPRSAADRGRPTAALRRDLARPAGRTGRRRDRSARCDPRRRDAPRSALGRSGARAPRPNEAGTPRDRAVVRTRVDPARDRPAGRAFGIGRL